MNEISRTILYRVEINDGMLTTLKISSNNPTQFYSESYSDYARLGKVIAENTHVKHLDITRDGIKLRDDDQYFEVTKYDRFFRGLKRNSSINKVTLRPWGATLVGGEFHEVLKAYQENNEHITHLHIKLADLQNGGEHAIAETLRCCTNIQELDINSTVLGGADRQSLQPIVETIRGHPSIESLSLTNCQLGTVECEVLANLLRDPNSNLYSLNLLGNIIDNEGISAISNGLVNNTKLRKLFLQVSSMNRNDACDIFSTLLCNTSSINGIHSSNHSLEIIAFHGFTLPKSISKLLNENMDASKSRVAIRKIMTYQPNIDMSQLFEFDKDDQWTLKALPYVVDWFRRAEYASFYELGKSVETKKLSAIYQFAQAMPLLFVPPSHIKDEDRKRKRDDTLLK